MGISDALTYPVISLLRTERCAWIQTNDDQLRAETWLRPALRDVVNSRKPRT